jgi:DNA (cytosine-5)-methyltransferase 1
MRVLDLFSGIGGFSLGLERAGMKTVAFCENNPFCRRVLHSHWPGVPIFDDIRLLKGWHVGPVDLITAGFPCQPWSLSGQRKGHDDDRDLWPETCRIVREIMPEWFIGENVPGLDDKRYMALDRVLFDLETSLYDTATFEIPACGVDAPHLRRRIIIVANRPCERLERGGHVGPRGRPQPTDGGGISMADRAGVGPSLRPFERDPQRPAALRGGHVGDGALPGCTRVGLSDRPALRREDFDAQWASAEWITDSTGKSRRIEPGIHMLAHGVSKRVDQIKGYGNAVVPQIVERFGRAIVHACSL